MTFIIDENITPELVPIFRKRQLHAYHINELKSYSSQKVNDNQIRRLSIQKGYIIVTRDDDFVKSHVNRKVPEKMIYLYGLDSKPILLERMDSLAIQLENWVNKHGFIEVQQESVNFPFS